MDGTPNQTPGYTPQPSTLPSPTIMSPEEFREFISRATPDQRAIMAGMFTDSAGPSDTTTVNPSPIHSPPLR